MSAQTLDQLHTTCASVTPLILADASSSWSAHLGCLDFQKGFDTMSPILDAIVATLDTLKAGTDALDETQLTGVCECVLLAMRQGRYAEWTEQINGLIEENPEKLGGYASDVELVTALMEAAGGFKITCDSIKDSLLILQNAALAAYFDERPESEGGGWELESLKSQGEAIESYGTLGASLDLCDIWGGLIGY